MWECVTKVGIGQCLPCYPGIGMAIMDSAVEWNSMWHTWWMEQGCQGVHGSTGAEEGAEAGGGN